ncbi:MAG: hypothetical protein AAF990_12100 [Bacteroidota bacterium]
MLCCQFKATASYFEFTPEARQAYRQAVELRFVEARSSLARLKQTQAENLIIYHIENYIDFFTIFLDENEEEFRSLEDNKDRRLAIIEKGDRDSPYYLYTQAEIKLQWALSRLKFEEYVTAFMEVRSAYKMLIRNQRRFPDFVANKKSLGILHALVGTIPDSYRWGVKLLGGMDGSIGQGRKEIEEVLSYADRNEFIFEEETRVLYALLMLHLENQQEAAWEIVNSAKLNPEANPLAAFVLANVAMHSGRNQEAIRLLERSPKGRAYHPFPYLDYMLGLTKLYELDATAELHFKQYLKAFRGRNYIKESYQKLAWLYLIQGKEAEYRRYIKQCLTKGAAVIGGDKQALKEAESEEMPHPDLLRARLLFDGGNYRRAYDLLIQRQSSDFAAIRHQLEYTYRLGRISHRLGRSTEAINFYKQTLQNGRENKLYFACNAALQMGLVYESKSELVKARQAYQACLSMRPREYQNSLHQKAKAGLNRLKDKS